MISRVGNDLIYSYYGEPYHFYLEKSMEALDYQMTFAPEEKRKIACDFYGIFLKFCSSCESLEFSHIYMRNEDCVVFTLYLMGNVYDKVKENVLNMAEFSDCFSICKYNSFEWTINYIVYLS